MSGVAKKVRAAQKKAKKALDAAKKIERIVDHPMQSLGGAVGAKLGNRKAGDSVGHLLGRIMGTGDYTVKTNSLATIGGAVDSAPTFVRAGRGMRVTHREYIGLVVASPTANLFSLTSYSINPGMWKSFPWLSQIAANFDQWQPNGMVVTYKSLSSTYSGTSSLGTVVLASDYDVYDAPYANKIEMENSEFCVSGNCARDLIHPIECNLRERFTKVLNVRHSAPTSGDSLRFYDLCNFQVATQGATAGQVCGELWLSYDITFYKEQIGSLTGFNLLGYHWKNTANYTPATGIFDTTSFTTFGNMDVKVDAGSGLYIRISNDYAGATFLIRLIMRGSAAVATNPSIIYADCVSVPGLIENGSSFVTPTGTSTSFQVLEYTVKVTGGQAQYAAVSALPWTTVATPYTDVQLVIMQVNPLIDVTP